MFCNIGVACPSSEGVSEHEAVLLTALQEYTVAILVSRVVLQLVSHICCIRWWITGLCSSTENPNQTMPFLERQQN